MKNNIHIVFGNYAKSRLLNSKTLDIPSENIIDLNDDLRVGPIHNLQNKEGNNIRNNWFFANLNCDRVDPSRSQDIEKIESIKSISFNKKLYIWSGNIVSDILSETRLLKAFQKLNFDIYSIDFSKIKLKRKDGTFYATNDLNLILEGDIPKIADYFEPLSKNYKIKSINLWEKVQSENSFMRVLNQNGIIESVEENYFDHVLKKHCKTEFEKPSRVVGHALVETNFNVHDSTLNWRLKHLIKDKELEYLGELKDMRDYQVKLVENKVASL